MTKNILFSTLFIVLLFIGCGGEGTWDGSVLVPPLLVAPEDGSTITQNPPTFIWQSVENSEIIYILEVATDEQFNDGSIVISATILPPDTIYSPHNPLPSGEYFWHMCIMENC